MSKKNPPTLLSPSTVGAFVFLINLVVFFLHPSLVKQIELKVFDFEIQLRNQFFPKIKKPSDVVILDIDEKSLKKFGRHPWPRETMAKVINKVHQYDPKMVALDVVFSEKVTASTGDLEEIAKLINEKKPILSKESTAQDRQIVNDFVITLSEAITTSLSSAQTANDLVLADAFAKNPNTLLGFIFTGDDEFPESIEKRLQMLAPQRACSGLNAPGYAISFSGMVTSLDLFSKNKNPQGFINVIPDIDGTIRQSPLLLEINQQLFPSLALQTLAKATKSTITCVADSKEILGIKLGKTTIPVGDKAHLMIDYYGAAKTFQYLSIADLMDNQLKEKDLAGKFVLLGTSAPALFDMRVTPLARAMPGVEIHATIIQNILSGHFLHRPSASRGIELFLLLIVGLLSIFSLGRLKALTGAMFTVGFGGLLVCGAIFLLVKSGLVFFVSTSMIALASIYFSMTLIHFFSTEKREVSEKLRREQIKNAFQHYVSASLVEEIIKEPARLKLGGERKELTVLFSDIRGFTTISERLTPEALTDLLNEYLTPMTDIILTHRGLLDKYMGDAIMAVFGAPLHFPDHATAACKAALEMSHHLKILQMHWRERNIPPLFVGVGLNTGDMSVGNMGSKQRFDYTVIGDNVNLGSRLEATNKFYGTEIIVSEFTKKSAGEGFLFRELDRLQVKGKTQGITIYELLCTQAEATGFLRELCQRFSEALAVYRMMDWNRAQKLFDAILAFHPEDKPSRVFLERISHYKNDPPPSDWQGVYEMKTK